MWKLVFLIGLNVWASTDESIPVPALEPQFQIQGQIEPGERFRRQEAVLRYFGIQDEGDPGSYFDGIEAFPSTGDLPRLKKIFDPSSQFSNFSVQDDRGLSVYQDLKNKTLLDFFIEWLRPQSPKAKGKVLRVALDPGHMGTTIWDERTGKYVRDSSGRRLSEGVLNLQVCLLLKEELERLGYEVIVTRQDLQPVINVPLEDFEVGDYARSELRNSALTDWFDSLLKTHPVGSDLFRSFERSSQVKSLFSQSQNLFYYERRADLDARLDLIHQFNPDLLFVVHFDTLGGGGNHGLNPQAPRTTRSFVPGAFLANEFASRSQRKFFARQYSDFKSWKNSVLLSRLATQSVAQKLGIKQAVSDGPETVKVENGVFARNLHIPRKLRGVPISYMEILFYNHPAEFNALARADYTMEIGGKSYSYSHRLKLVVEALRDAVQNYSQVNSLSSLE